MNDIRPVRYPFGVQHRCAVCGCNVNPNDHVSGSEECYTDRAERIASQSE